MDIGKECECDVSPIQHTKKFLPPWPITQMGGRRRGNPNHSTPHIGKNLFRQHFCCSGLEMVHHSETQCIPVRQDGFL